MIWKALAMAAALTLSSCASVPMTAEADDASARRFEPPPPEQAALYIFREGQFGASVTLSISIGQRMVGPLASDTFFRLDMPPGDYEIRCNAENTVAVPVRLIANGTAYVRASVRLGMASARCAAAEVTNSIGQAAILKGHRAQEVR